MGPWCCCRLSYMYIRVYIYIYEFTERERESGGCLTWLHLSCRITSSSRSLNCLIVNCITISFDWSLSKGIPMAWITVITSPQRTAPHIFYGLQNVLTFEGLNSYPLNSSAKPIRNLLSSHAKGDLRIDSEKRTQDESSATWRLATCFVFRGIFAHKIISKLEQETWGFCLEPGEVKEHNNLAPYFFWYFHDASFCHPTQRSSNGVGWLVVWNCRIPRFPSWWGQDLCREAKLVGWWGQDLLRLICQALNVLHLQLYLLDCSDTPS